MSLLSTCCIYRTVAYRRWNIHNSIFVSKINLRYRNIWEKCFPDTYCYHGCWRANDIL